MPKSCKTSESQSGIEMRSDIATVQNIIEKTMATMDKISPVVALESKLPASLRAIIARIMPAIPTGAAQNNAIMPQISEPVAFPSPGLATSDGGPVYGGTCPEGTW